MLAVDRALVYLEETTGFGRALDEIVVGRGGWPNRWLTPGQINDELTARGFWRGPRRHVHLDARVRLLTRYLDHRVERPGQPITTASSDLPDNTASDLHADDSAASNRFASLAHAAGGTSRGTSASGGEWKRFDGQYKHNPRTKLIEYRGQRMASNAFDRRAFTRVPVAGVKCQYGRVADMSTMGLRFHAPRSAAIEVGHRGYLRLAYGRISLRVRVKIVWISPGDRDLEIGADYRNLTSQDHQTILRIVAAAGDDEGLLPEVL